MATHDDCPADATNTAVPAPRQKPTRNPRKMAKPIVAAGGISKRTAFPTTHVSKKTKGKPSRVREAHPVHPCAAPQPTPAPQSIAINAEEALVPPACIGGDIDSTPENTQITHPSAVGLADRLVSYSQKLISSIGLYKPFPESSFIEVSNDSVRMAGPRIEIRPPAPAMPSSHPPQSINDISSTHNEPLRLSEISPHKLLCNAPRPGSPAYTETLQDGREHAMSPMRPAKKRISMDADQPQEYHRRKRGKIMPADGDSPRRGTACTRIHLSRTLKRVTYRPKLTSSWCKGPTLDAFPYSSGPRQVHDTINRGKCNRDAGQSKAASVRSVPSLSGFSAKLPRATRKDETRARYSILLCAPAVWADLDR
ncbi:hypothetical protein HD554DRAFT_1178283 [Boletus coccyginus]|nr:hypothetical protein HD554DRAFT_1178283 [Boletus coccyginus]